MGRGRIEAAAMILAAGRSSRFGGRPKALASFDGRTLLKRAAEIFRRAGVTRLAVVTGHHRTEVAAAAEALEVPTVHNPEYDQGMFSSIKAGLAGVTGGEAFFVLPVDAALVHPQTVLALLTAWREIGRGRRGCSVIVPTHGGRTGHPPLIGGIHIPDILHWAGPGGLRGWLASLLPTGGGDFWAGRAPESSGGPVLFPAQPDAGVLTDIDTADDLARARPGAVRDRPAPAEAWQLLWQAGLPPEKLRHSRQVAAGALRLSLALAEAGLPADAELSLLAGLLHDLARRERRHAHAARLWCEDLGWPDLGLVVGAHTDPPAALLARIGWRSAPEAGEGDPAGDGYEEISETVAGSALAVYLADKYWWEDQPMTLRQRFQAAREMFGRKPAALRAVDRREETALAVEGWFRRRLGQEPEAVVRTPSVRPLEKALRRLRPKAKFGKEAETT